MALPAEARAGLMRAWIKVLTDRYPDHTWIPANPENITSPNKPAAPLTDAAELASSA